MKIKTHAFKLAALLLVFTLGLPLVVNASRPTSHRNTQSLAGQLVSQIKGNVCTSFASNSLWSDLSLPKFCKDTTPPPPPPPPPLVPIVDLSAGSTLVIQGATTTLLWTSSNTTSCLASGAWTGNKSLSGNEIITLTATSTYTLNCSNGVATSSDSVTINVIIPVEPEPEPTLDHLIISEIYYDTASTTDESDGPNEWVEIYNGTGAGVDVAGWTVGDATASSSDMLATTTIPHGGFLIITSSSTTSGFWPMPASTTVLVLPNAIGSNGLSNTGDAVFLKNGSGTLIDAVSYGSNVDVFNPAAVDVPDGHSLRRADLSTGTDLATDWVDSATPNPGSF